jgi:hypothetical protein
MSRADRYGVSSSRALEDALGILIRSSTLDRNCDPAVLRVGAVRLLLRMVFVFMAESLKLLPVGNTVYQDSYALSVLSAQLRVRAGGSRKGSAPTHAGWARVSSLCRLLYRGSTHPAFPLPAYGGSLFAPGEDNSEDPVSRQLAHWEIADHGPDDASLGQMLEALTRALKPCHESSKLAGSEFLGRLYERLLELELVPSVAPSTGGWTLSSGRAFRKNLGSFYTPIWLADRVVRRTLGPLCRSVAGRRSPEDIANLRILDPAMGSGTFLVSALRFLSEEVSLSLKEHGRITPLLPKGTRVDVARDLCWEFPESVGSVALEAQIRARLRRFLVDRCLCGVDVDPVSAEIARFALWLETLDGSLPFSFLDHRLKRGNFLLGCHLEQSVVYPLRATRRRLETDCDGGGRTLLLSQWKCVIRELKEPSLPFANTSSSHGALLDAGRTLRELVAVPVQFPERKRLLHEKMRHDTAWRTWKQQMDLWCALWFWPVHRDLPPPDPITYYTPTDHYRGFVDTMALDLGFLHVELEFPDVFGQTRHGFDAIIGNPPWDVVRGDGCCPDADSMRRFVQESSRPAGTRTAELLGAPTRRGRKRGGRFGGFRHQGTGELNLYKLFLERSLGLLGAHGRLGMVVPSGFYSDRGTAALRRHLLETTVLEEIWRMDNRSRVFDIDGRFRFCALIARMGGKTSTVVMREPAGSSSAADAPDVSRVPLSVAFLRQVSPVDLAFPSLDNPRELEVFQRICLQHPALGAVESGFGRNLRYARELDLSVWKNRLIPAESLPVGDRTWDSTSMDEGEGPTGQRLLPVVQGAMIHQFRWGYGVWTTSGWQRPEGALRIAPRYFIDPVAYQAPQHCPSAAKVVLRRIARNTDERTLIATVLPNLPVTDKTPSMSCGTLVGTLALCGLLNSFVCDWVARILCQGTNVDRHHLDRLPVPLLDDNPLWVEVAQLVLLLSCDPVLHRKTWEEWHYLYPDQGSALNGTGTTGPLDASRSDSIPDSASTPVSAPQRRWLRARLDAMIAGLYGLTRGDMEVILDGCDHPVIHRAGPDFARTLNPRGFWRVDQQLPPEQRHTVMVLGLMDGSTSPGDASLLTSVA